MNSSKKKVIASAAVAATIVAGLASCASHYELSSISRTRILVDSRYDAQPDKAAAEFIAPYKQRVDSIMSPVVGRSARFMAAHRPESELSNLLPDILVWASEQFGEKPDFAVYNMGGIRAALPEGDVTIGDVLDVAPFENKICFLTLSGEKTQELLSQIAHRGGEGISHSVQIKADKQRRLISAAIDGKPVDKNRSYRIATLDYVAQGNDEMSAFKAKTDVVSPQEEIHNVRYLIMDYFRYMAKNGHDVDSKIEGRFIIE